MTTRLISAQASEILQMSAEELKQSIKASEGRTVVSENIVQTQGICGLTNAEIAKAFGADLILLNKLDVFDPEISGLEVADKNKTIKRLRELTGRPIGVNLEPVDDQAEMNEEQLVIGKGRKASAATFKEADKLGFDFVCLTGNPATGVTNEQILHAIVLAHNNFSGLVIAGKMHSSGANEAVIDEETVNGFLAAGADIILVPAVGTVPGFTSAELQRIIKMVHQKDGLVMTTIGTSQESSGAQTIHDLALANKICGADLQHIEDAAWGVVSPIETVFELSRTIRGLNHTIDRMARSIKR